MRLEMSDQPAYFSDDRVVAELGRIHPGDGADLRLIAAEDDLERIADFTQRGAGLRGGDGELKEVDVARPRTGRQRGQ